MGNGCERSKAELAFGAGPLQTMVGTRHRGNQNRGISSYLDARSRLDSQEPLVKANIIR